MTGPELRRIFWIGAAVILIAAALIGVAGILRGDFGETDAKILGTLFVLLLSGATGISGLALVERAVLVPFGWAAAVLAAVSFIVVAAAVWTEFETDALADWAGRAIALLVALLLVATQLLMLRVPRLAGVVAGTAAMASLATLLTAVAIGDSGDDGLWQAAAVFWVFTALGYLLLPVVQRFSAAGLSPVAARVLDELDDIQLVATSAGTIDPRLAPGERLLLRRRV